MYARQNSVSQTVQFIQQKIFNDDTALYNGHTITAFDIDREKKMRVFINDGLPVTTPLIHLVHVAEVNNPVCDSCGIHADSNMVLLVRDVSYKKVWRNDIQLWLKEPQWVADTLLFAHPADAKAVAIALTRLLSLDNYQTSFKKPQQLNDELELVTTMNRLFKQAVERRLAALTGNDKKMMIAFVDTPYYINRKGILSATYLFKKQDHFYRIRTEVPVSAIKEVWHDNYIGFTSADELVTIFKKEQGDHAFKVSGRSHLLLIALIGGGGENDLISTSVKKGLMEKVQTVQQYYQPGYNASLNN